jgi:hypothetical protein
LAAFLFRHATGSGPATYRHQAGRKKGILKMGKFASNIELSSFIERILNSFWFFFGREFTIASDAPGRSLWDFEKRTSPGDVHEFFGLGLHLILFPLRIPKK